MNSEKVNQIGKEILKNEIPEGQTLKVSKDENSILLNKNGDHYSMNSICNSPYGIFTCSFGESSESPIFSFLPQMGESKLVISLDKFIPSGTLHPNFEFTHPFYISGHKFVFESHYFRGKNIFSLASQFRIPRLNTNIDLKYGKTISAKLDITLPYLRQIFSFTTDEISSITSIGTSNIFAFYRFSRQFEQHSNTIGAFMETNHDKLTGQFKIDNLKNKTIQAKAETKLGDFRFAVNAKKVLKGNFDINFGVATNYKSIDAMFKTGASGSTYLSLRKQFGSFDAKCKILLPKFEKVTPNISIEMNFK